MAVGFAFDLYLAKRPDSLADNILLLSYLVLVGFIIIILNVRSKRRRAIEKEHPVEPLFLLLVLQFCFGGLANNLLILYGKSGSLGGSAFFILLLAGFALGNEFLKSRYAQLRFNVVIYYILLLTYIIIATPTFLLHSVGANVFLISGFLSLVCIGIFLYLLYILVFRGERKQLYEVAGLILGVFFIFNGLYFLNIIPPVPLSMKQIGVYHSLDRLPQGTGPMGALYQATYEKPSWYVFWRDTAATYTQVAGQRAYCFSAVFAPTDLSTPISHRWEKYNEQTGKWETRALATFSINGGRTDGYRGFSVEDSLDAGSWRCDVETAPSFGRSQSIGRISFTVVEASTTPVLSTTTL